MFIRKLPVLNLTNLTITNVIDVFMLVRRLGALGGIQCKILQNALIGSKK